jgi:plasmid stabilization system protein ParE
MGHKREDLTVYPILFWPVETYMILYRVQKEFIEIVAVTQGARDILSFLQYRIQ